MNKRILHIYSQMRNWCNNVTNTTASIIGTILHKVLNMEAIFRHVYINIDIHRFICTCFIFKHCIKHKINNRSDCVLKRESEKRNAALDLKYKHCSTTKLTFFPSICRIKKAHHIYPSKCTVWEFWNDCYRCVYTVWDKWVELGDQLSFAQSVELATGLMVLWSWRPVISPPNVADFWIIGGV